MGFTGYVCADAAAKHFTAASFYGTVAAIAGGGAIASRLAFGPATTAAAAAQDAGSGSGGGDNNNAPQYAPFNYGNSTFSASQANAQGSRTDNVLMGVLNRIAGGQRQVVASNTLVANHVAALHAKIDSIPGGDLIRANPHAVGDSLQDAVKSYHPVTQDIVSLGSRGIAY